MAGNSELIDSIIDPKAVKQVTDLTKELEVLEAQFVETTKVAIALNNATAKTTSFQKLEQDANKTAIALQKLQQEQNKTATTQANLNKANSAAEAQLNRTAQAQAKAQQQQEKATEAAKKALSPYQQLSKELDRMRAAAKDTAIQFGTNSEQFKTASKNVQDLDGKLKSIDQTLGQSQRNVGNYGNAFKGILSQYIPFGDSTLKISENLKTLGGDIEGSTESLTGLGAGFAEFSTGAFVVAVAAATYYLSQFKSTADKITEVKGGLSNLFASLGQGIFGGGSQHQAYDEARAFSVGKETAAAQIELQDKQEIEQIHNQALSAQGQYFRALSDDRTKDIADRITYLNKAQAIEKKILDSQKETAQATLSQALKVGFLNSDLSDSEISRQKGILAVAAQSGNLKPAQDLAKEGTKFTNAGLDLYKQALQQINQYNSNAAIESVRINDDKNNKELRAGLEEAKAEDALRKAQIQGALLASKTILDDVKASNSQKLAANSNYATQSIALINLEKQNQLEAAGLGTTRGGKDSKAQAINRAAIEQTAQNEITAVQNTAQKTRQDIFKNSIDAQLKLDKARIDGVLDADRLIIDDESATYEARLNANRDFVNKSIALLNEQQKNQLQAAGLTGNPKSFDKTQLNNYNSILQETQNAKNRIYAAGVKETETIEKENYDATQKRLQDILKLSKDSVDNTLAVLSVQNNQALDLIQGEKDKEIKIVEDKYTKGKLSLQEYNRDIKAIEDQANVDRLGQLAFNDQQILEIRQAALKNSIEQIQQSNPISITDFLTNPLGSGIGLINKNAQISDAKKNSGVSEAKQAVSAAGQNLQQGIAQQGSDNTKSQADIEAQKRADEIQGIQDISNLENDASKLLQANTQNEINLLEQKKQLIEDTAKSDIEAVNNSIASAKTKQEQVNLINAKAAQAEAKLTKQQSQLKRQQAIEEKEFNIASIIQNTAVAVIKTYAEGGFFGGIVGAAIVAALGAAELATVIAQPIPSFEKGTKSAPGGISRVGEKGIELVKPKNGTPFLTPNSESFMDIPTGAEIVPHDKLMRMMAFPQKLNFVGGQATDMSTVEKLLKENIKVTKANKPGKIYFKTPGSPDWQAFERSKKR